MAQFYQKCNKCGIYRVRGSRTKLTTECKCDSLLPTNIISLNDLNHTHKDIYEYIKTLRSNCSICGCEPKKNLVWNTSINPNNTKPQYLRMMKVNNITPLGEPICDKCLVLRHSSTIQDNLSLLYYTNLIFEQWLEMGLYLVVKVRHENKPYFTVFARDLHGSSEFKHSFPLKYWDNYFISVPEIKDLEEL